MAEADKSEATGFRLANSVFLLLLRIAGITHCLQFAVDHSG